mmetsp:Transcript_7225/g.18997  ORF Transcript_7225/g.18997 Transcript_7225/m.18997 type:complete len:273 (-) Transcript_7225:339-1157(-)
MVNNKLADEAIALALPRLKKRYGDGTSRTGNDVETTPTVAGKRPAVEEPAADAKQLAIHDAAAAQAAVDMPIAQAEESTDAGVLVETEADVPAETEAEAPAETEAGGDVDADLPAETEADAPAETESADPYNLGRFVEKQRTYHSCAVQELRAGHKASCWSWWILPTPPFMRNGVDVGSGFNKVFAISNDAEGCAYLRSKYLRDNYVEVLGATSDALAKGITPRRLMGIDVPRLEASARYFHHLSGLCSPADDELRALCSRTLQLMNESKGA